MDNWIPSEAMEMANNFRSNHGNDLSPELITELLKSLNKVWRDREKKQIVRIRDKCIKEITDAKRFNFNKISFETIQLKKSISTLS